jgi:hypothetical protein
VRTKDGRRRYVLVLSVLLTSTTFLTACSMGGSSHAAAPKKPTHAAQIFWARLAQKRQHELATATTTTIPLPTVTPPTTVAIPPLSPAALAVYPSTSKSCRKACTGPAHVRRHVRRARRRHRVKMSVKTA